MSYDLFRGPTPEHIRTYDQWWADVLQEKWFHDHIKLSKPEFVGAMPVRVDEPVIPSVQWDKGLDLRGWEHVGFSVRWIRSTWWSRLKHRFKLFFNLYPPPPGDGQYRETLI